MIICIKIKIVKNWMIIEYQLSFSKAVFMYGVCGELYNTSRQEC